ncbi:MAG: hypothetical protein FJW79_11510, partial [Actinobacteria bacterium]|nr:hypothetical protein [Actinomycetota bacterium]
MRRSRSPRPERVSASRGAARHRAACRGPAAVHSLGERPSGGGFDMPPSSVMGHAARSAGQALEPFAYEAPELRDDQVRVDVTHCGVCHTDIHAVDGDYGVFVFPIVPGHEIVGRVVEAGSAVTGVSVGDRVGIGWQGRCCGECRWCRAAQEHLCLHIADCGTWTPYGGFASSVVVDGRFAYPLPAGMAAEAAAVLMCAGIAVYPPLRRYAGPGIRG